MTPQSSSKFKAQSSKSTVHSPKSKGQAACACGLWTLTLGPFARRWLRFNVVSAAGVLVQAGALAGLLGLLGRHYLLATGLAVEAAVLHNFFWHWKWTWADRPGLRARKVLPVLVRFNVTTGAVSIVGNIVLMRLLVGLAGLNPLLANLLSIAACWVLNFLLSDRLVFVPRCQPAAGGTRAKRLCHSKRSHICVTCCR